MDEEVQAGGAILRFAGSGCIEMRFVRNGRVTGDDARRMIAAIDARVPPPAPLRVLVDARDSHGMSLAARLDFVDWIRRNGERYRGAAHDVPPVMEATGNLVIASVGSDRFHLFRTEAEARAWLLREARAPSAARPQKA